jgi:hypothetical protein
MPEGSEREVMTSWDYNQSGRLIRQIEAVDIPEQKTTHFSYYPSGELKTKVKPDGTELLLRFLRQIGKDDLIR